MTHEEEEEWTEVKRVYNGPKAISAKGVSEEMIERALHGFTTIEFANPKGEVKHVYALGDLRNLGRVSRNLPRLSSVPDEDAGKVLPPRPRKTQWKMNSRNPPSH